jgi:antitoxin component HigA of HigAB toxin-antitoxin module
MRLLGVLIEDYDHRYSLPTDDSTPAERLRFLMEHAGKTATDLLPVFHQRSHVNEALNGRRKINPEQARQLGKMFGVKPALFARRHKGLLGEVCVFASRYIPAWVRRA